MNQKYIRLHNGIMMPELSFDTENLVPSQAYRNIGSALESGYRGIDTSADFGVEKDIAKAVQLSGIPRHELFIIDEIPLRERKTLTAVHDAEVSLKRLGMDYVDLFLISWTGGDRPDDSANAVVRETWRAIEDLYKKGNALAIGILDFRPWQIEYLLQYVEIAPMTAMAPLYPGRKDASALLACMEDHRIQPMAYLPRKDEELLHCKELNIFAEKYHTNVYGVIRQYLRQKGCIAVFRVNANEIGDEEFAFTEQEMKYLEVMKDYCEKEDKNG